MAQEVPKIATLDEGEDGVAGLCMCGYKTSGWPTKVIATERIKQHQDEHISWIENEDDSSKWKLMEPLEEFRARHGLMQSEDNPNLAVFPEGAKEIRTPKPKATKAEDKPAEEEGE